MVRVAKWICSATTLQSGLTYATVRSAMETMERLGLVNEIRDSPSRTFHYARYLDILERGTEPLYPTRANPRLLGAVRAKCERISAFSGARSSGSCSARANAASRAAMRIS